MLRSDQWFPRWSPVSVEICEPIMASGKDFASILRLRDATRRVILERCGEPDLVEPLKPAVAHDRNGTFSSEGEVERS
jgi:hypothetical protein